MRVYVRLGIGSRIIAVPEEEEPANKNKKKCQCARPWLKERFEERAHLKLCIARHHSLQANADTFYDSQEHGTADCVVAGRLEASADGQRAAGEEAGDNGIIGILLFADALDSAVICGKQSTPDACAGSVSQSISQSVHAQ